MAEFGKIDDPVEASFEAWREEQPDRRVAASRCWNI